MSRHGAWYHVGLAVGGVLSCAIAACSGPPSGGASSSAPLVDDSSASGAPDEPLATAGGEALVRKYECARCHEGTGQAEVAHNQTCVKCHFDIAEGTFAAPADALAEWRPHVVALRFAPSLSGLGRLVQPAWAERFLTKPFDLRPELHPQMPRLAIDTLDAKAIVAFLADRHAQEAPIPTIEAPAGNAQRGRSLFVDKTCSNCHSFGGAGTLAPRPIPPSRLPRDRALAPDLRFARERLIAQNVVAYLLDPKSVKADAAMPKLDLTVQDAADLTAFVLTTALDDPPARVARPRLPVLDRPVAYDEVAEKVLHKTCWHCHSQPDYARGDGGPGNTGGFGFPARKLDLSSYESILAGSVDARGERRSVFGKGPTGAPLLVEALLAREAEDRGLVGDTRGMPLGLPPLSAEDIQLVESWVAQGHVR